MSILTSPLNAVVNLFSLALISVIVIAVAIIGLSVSGGPSACNPSGGPITITAFHADSFQEKWDELKLNLENGASASARFDESELTSRTERFIREQTDVEVNDLRICLREGQAEVTGHLQTGLGLKVKVLLAGSADFSSDPAQAQVSRVEIGSLPGLLLDLAERARLDAADAVDEVLASLFVDHTYRLTFTAGEVIVGAQPSPDEEPL